MLVHILYVATELSDGLVDGNVVNRESVPFGVVGSVVVSNTTGVSGAESEANVNFFSGPRCQVNARLTCKAVPWVDKATVCRVGDRKFRIVTVGQVNVSIIVVSTCVVNGSPSTGLTVNIDVARIIVDNSVGNTGR